MTAYVGVYARVLLSSDDSVTGSIASGGELTILGRKYWERNGGDREWIQVVTLKRFPERRVVSKGSAKWIQS